MTDNNNNSQLHDPDEDPTVELEVLTEAACEELTHFHEAANPPDLVVATDDYRANDDQPEPKITDENAVLVEDLRDELKFREEMNSILQLGIDQQRDKCQSLLEQVADLEGINAELRRELERLRQQTVKTEQQLAITRSSEKALIDNLNELGKENAINADLAAELRSSNVQLENYRDQIADLRRASKPAIQETVKPAVGETPIPQETDRWVLAGLDGNDADAYTVGDGIVTIGSSSDSDIQIQSQFISHRHAQLIKTHKGCVLRDLGSTNGTFINSRRVNKRILRSGDTVTIGKHRFRYEKLAADRITADVQHCR